MKQTTDQIIRKAVNIISLSSYLNPKPINRDVLERAIQAVIDVDADFNEVEIAYYYDSINIGDQLNIIKGNYE